ncbi:MAG: hypothetical protein HY074_11875 [Deltaproteobacteria bacterium]|nr:hypothetical protein [Deltaproteobacteria bacterium]
MLNIAIALVMGANVHAGIDRNIVPENWYSLPEDSGLRINEAVSTEGKALKPREKEAALTKLLDNIFEANGEALDQLGTTLDNATPDPRRPKDWTAWHAEYFATDLSISASGLLGALTWKGSPSVQVFWRRQNEARKPAVPALPPEKTEVPSLNITSDMPEGQISAQLEPAIRAMVAGGKINDENALRKNLTAAAENFQAVVAGLEKDPGFQWWVSRFRLDVTIDVSGKVNPFLGMGAETKFRFDWARIQAKQGAVTRQRKLAAADARVKSNLEEFVRATAADLEAITASGKVATGFQMYQFRVGIGATATGTIGIVKGTGSVLGQIYFAQNVKKPVVHPRESVDDYVNVIEAEHSKAHMNFAEANGIAFDSSADEVVYKVERAKFRKGIERALKMGSFFAARASQKPGRRWKVFEMRPAFDLSLTGALGLVTVGGLASVELDYYNENF